MFVWTVRVCVSLCGCVCVCVLALNSLSLKHFGQFRWRMRLELRVKGGGERALQIFAEGQVCAIKIWFNTNAHTHKHSELPAHRYARIQRRGQTCVCLHSYLPVCWWHTVSNFGNYLRIIGRKFLEYRMEFNWSHEFSQNSSNPHTHTRPLTYILHTFYINKSDGTLTLLRPWGLLMPYIFLAFDVEFLIFIKQPPALMTGFFPYPLFPEFSMGLLTSGWCSHTHSRTHSHCCVFAVCLIDICIMKCVTGFSCPHHHILRNSRRSCRKPQLALKICWHFPGFLIVKFGLAQGSWKIFHCPDNEIKYFIR